MDRELGFLQPAGNSGPPPGEALVAPEPRDARQAQRWAAAARPRPAARPSLVRGPARRPRALEAAAAATAGAPGPALRARAGP